MIHVIGAGLAGLAAALTIADAGRPVTIWEAGPHCGGRCRSFHDRALDARIDNGNHLLLSGNDATFAFLRRLGTADTLGGPPAAEFHFFDPANAKRWVVAPGPGRVPWWLLRRAGRVPGTRLAEWSALVGLLRARPDRTVRAVIGDGPLARQLLDPLAIAILNTRPERGSAALLGAVFRESLFRGGRACVPRFPRVGLSETFIDPALAALGARGAVLRTGARVAGFAFESGRVSAINGPDGAVPVGADDAVVLAVPAPNASALLPGVRTPDRFEAIANVHFRTDLLPKAPALRRAGFVGLTGDALAEWVFSKPGIVSVTISAANRYELMPNEALVRRSWIEAVRALDLADADGRSASVTDAPPSRVVREKRATFEATPEAERRRPGVADGPANLALAGDWTASGLPATIEGAIRSGRTAAEALLARG